MEIIFPMCALVPLTLMPRLTFNCFCANKYSQPTLMTRWNTKQLHIMGHPHHEYTLIRIFTLKKIKKGKKKKYNKNT